MKEKKKEECERAALNGCVGGLKRKKEGERSNYVSDGKYNKIGRERGADEIKEASRAESGGLFRFAGGQSGN